MPDNGLVTVASAHSARETMERLLAALKAHNMTVFARIRAHRSRRRRGFRRPVVARD
jgi:hypothetical protein